MPRADRCASVWIMPLSDFPLRASIAVSAIQRAVAFYEGNLGLQAWQSGPGAAIRDDTFAIEADA